MFGAALVWAKVSGSSLLIHQQLPVTQAPVGTPSTPYDPALVHQTLEFYAAQARRDPGSAISAAFLAHEYLESYRETGDNADALRAEQAARASLAIRTRNNGDALFQLSRALLAQHRFPQALVEARRAAQFDPNGLRECADIEFEIGDYARAESDIKAARSASVSLAREVALQRGDTRPAKPGDDPAFLALVSRVNELHGDSKGQIVLLRRAAQGADDNSTTPPQSVAWFHERLGRALSMQGQLDEAEKNYSLGLQVFPRDYRSMAALAHLYAARGQWQKTIEWGQKAAQIVPSPETLALLGDAYGALGQKARAQAQWKLVGQIGQLSRAQGVIYDRQRALFLADHDLQPVEAVRLARGELSLRHDIYAFDTLAWTLFKANRLDEASANSARALKFGTRDASLYFHAGMIAAAQNKVALGHAYLSRALEINPAFHPSYPAQARATLARLGSISATQGTARGANSS